MELAEYESLAKSIGEKIGSKKEVEVIVVESKAYITGKDSEKIKKASEEIEQIISKLKAPSATLTYALYVPHA